MPNSNIKLFMSFDALSAFVCTGCDVTSNQVVTNSYIEYHSNNLLPYKETMMLHSAKFQLCQGAQINVSA